jgi:XTP/dITP diphosphohydrolase
VLLYACSSNPGKLAEFALAAQIAGLDGIQIRPLPDLESIDPPGENGETFEENAATKALFYSGFTQEIVFADDSGLEVDALGGEPGVRSARYAGDDATDVKNNELLLRNLKSVLNRHARFVCAIAVARAGKLLITAGGTVEGEILEEPRGENGFGYDPLFFYPPLERSFGELPPEMKFSVSHRGNAVRSFIAKLQGSLPRTELR